jgi:hypothetical protein
MGQGFELEDLAHQQAHVDDENDVQRLEHTSSVSLGSTSMAHVSVAMAASSRSWIH